MPLDEASANRYAHKSAFLEWCEKDGLSVIGGYGVDDLKNAPLMHWDRLRGLAVYCHLEGSPKGFVGVTVAEILHGKSLNRSPLAISASATPGAAPEASSRQLSVAAESERT